MSSISNVALPTNSDSNDFGDDTSNDVAVFCLGLHLERMKVGENRGESSWIGCGPASKMFRSMLPQTYFKAASKDEAAERVKIARSDAILGGFIQMGRRKSEANGGIPKYVAIVLFKKTDDSKLSRELYVQLLPLGRNLAIESRSLEEASMPLKIHGTHKTISARQQKPIYEECAACYQREAVC
jgi:hypothetical protein